MKKRNLWILVVLCLLVFVCPMSVSAGTFEETSSGWRYRKDDGNYARSEWVLDQGTIVAQQIKVPISRAKTSN